MFSFKKQYFFLAILLSIAEVLIASFFNDRIIRPYVGDLLVVILIYCCLRSIINLPFVTSALAGLLFACLVETFQYLNLLQQLGLQNSKLARLVLGSSFEWMDILMYILGSLIVVITERSRLPKKQFDTPGIPE